RRVRQEKATMAVQDTEAPRGEHKQPDSRKENPHEADRELALLTLESACDDREELRREKNAQQHQDGDDERERREHSTGDTAGLLFAIVLEEPRVDWDEGRRQSALTEQILKEVGNARGGVESVSCCGSAEVPGDD